MDTLSPTVEAGRNIVFLPLAMKNKNSLFRATLGARIENDIVPYEQWLINNRTYHWSVDWATVERYDGKYSWPIQYDRTYEALKIYETIITVKGCPSWARLWPDINSPPKDEYLPNLALFMDAVQVRYNPVAIEFYNEPDCKRGMGEPGYFGEWIDHNESWYAGGIRYGSAIRQIYPYISSRLIVGALMMSVPEYSLQFLQGALAAGLTGDCLSFHCYVHLGKDYERPMKISRKIEEICGLPQAVTETSLIGPDGTELRVAQKDYLEYILPWEGVILKEWYTIEPNSWKSCSLLDKTVPKLVYYSWRA